MIRRIEPKSRNVLGLILAIMMVSPCEVRAIEDDGHAPNCNLRVIEGQYEAKLKQNSSFEPDENLQAILKKIEVDPKAEVPKQWSESENAALAFQIRSLRTYAQSIHSLRIAESLFKLVRANSDSRVRIASIGVIGEMVAASPNAIVLEHGFRRFQSEIRPTLQASELGALNKAYEKAMSTNRRLAYDAIKERSLPADLRIKAIHISTAGGSFYVDKPMKDLLYTPDEDPEVLEFARAHTGLGLAEFHQIRKGIVDSQKFEKAFRLFSQAEDAKKDPSNANALSSQALDQLLEIEVNPVSVDQATHFLAVRPYVLEMIKEGPSLDHKRKALTFLFRECQPGAGDRAIDISKSQIFQLASEAGELDFPIRVEFFKNLEKLISVTSGKEMDDFYADVVTLRDQRRVWPPSVKSAAIQRIYNHCKEARKKNLNGLDMDRLARIEAWMNGDEGKSVLSEHDRKTLEDILELNRW